MVQHPDLKIGAHKGDGWEGSALNVNVTGEREDFLHDAHTYSRRPGWGAHVG